MSIKLIYSKDLVGGLRITEPGYYQFAENISWQAQDSQPSNGQIWDNPTQGSQIQSGQTQNNQTPSNQIHAIAIECDQVTLDLAGYHLIQINPSKPLLNIDPNRGFRNTVVSGNVGVWADNQNNICIRNGTVLNIQGVGIALRNCHIVDLSDLNVNGCGGDGAIDTSFLYRNGGIFIMGTHHDDPSKSLYSSHIRLTNCVCTHNSSQLDFVVTLGALVQNCENVAVKQSTFNANSNTSPEPSGVQFNVVGIDFVRANKVSVVDCEAHDNTSGGEPAGFFAWGEDYTFINCRAHGNYTLSGHRACGFNISTTDGLVMQNCEANHNYNTNPEAASDSMPDFSACGFRLGRATKNGVLQNCQALGNYSVGQNAPVAGFMLNSTTNILVKDCVAINNRLRAPSPDRFASPNASASQPENQSPNESPNQFLDPKAWVAGFMASSTLPLPAVDDAGDKKYPLEQYPLGQYQLGCGNAFIDCIADAQSDIQSAAQPDTQSAAAVLSSAGFVLDQQQYVRVLRCQASLNQGHGIRLNLCESSLLTDNVLYGNAGEAIQINPIANSPSDDDHILLNNPDHLSNRPAIDPLAENSNEYCLINRRD